MEGRIGSPVEIVGYLAADEERDAFVLTFRMFLQNNEPFSIHKINQLYQNLPALAPLAPRIRHIRDVVNRYLDAPSTIIWQKEQLTRRRILGVFLYGGLAHTHAEKTVEYDRWMSHEYMAIPLQTEFYDILVEVTTGILAIRT